LGEPTPTEGDEDPFFRELRRTLDLTWEDDFFDDFQDDIVAVFYVDYEPLTTFETAKLWAILCTVIFVIPHGVIPGLLLCATQRPEVCAGDARGTHEDACLESNRQASRRFPRWKTFLEPVEKELFCSLCRLREESLECQPRRSK
jgi:hypothetical protein